MKKIEELQQRSSLSEGRDHGLGFAVLNPIDTKKTKFQTFNAFTACKDYLNDFSYVEFKKKEIGSVYGYNHKLLNCFDNKRFFYLGVKTLNHKNGKKWEPKKEATKILIDNYLGLEKILNNIEEKLGLKTFSKISIDEDTLIIKAPLYWMKSTPLISVYTLMIRCLFNVSSDDIFSKDFNLDNYLKKHKAFIQGDAYLYSNIENFLKESEKNIDFTKIDYDKLNKISAGSIHNFGISEYLMTVK